MPGPYSCTDGFRHPIANQEEGERSEYSWDMVYHHVESLRDSV
jgi:hypothetical protein